MQATQATIRPRRSVLYVPGSNLRALEKARTLPADGLIFDLEDSVAPEVKETARQNVLRAIEQGGFGKRELFLRVNGLNTPWGYDDLWAAAQSKADAVVLPKVDGPEVVKQAVSVLWEAKAPEQLSVWCMMETARGMLHAESIANASTRLGGLVMGTSDLAHELHAAHTPLRLPMLTALGLCLLAARAAGIPILDGVYLDLADDKGFEASCQQGMELGFDGKTLIHPRTIEIANRVFAPSNEQVQRAKAIIVAFEEASAAGKGVVVVEGKLVENLHVENAKRIVKLSEAIESTKIG
ncbi:MAG TPA: CoA ester lyase [Polyangiaceae bacterium]|jgi:citrate lyase subunit beta/citryl-CoA lyase|nr:MAG: (3S)-malyl-CoA thioesterase [Deltaproteobacteria bacterium ADurb.Bin207]HNS99043.1 CoA ester lyase [Polyangiaceae bacterium]HNZ23832.1 CoA ester lyase [Polyangiaceae bacterium]HOD22375.1 CoA ester lyase [Polyangiaceae bacterium]HOE50558.1 CoA ester lyase [Polyangiaceae bacterium]